MGGGEGAEDVRVRVRGCKGGGCDTEGEGAVVSGVGNGSF